jgi:pimeloyl-ACP methyl ester carboxylesterase
MSTLLWIGLALVAPVAVSMVVEVMRRKPVAPAVLGWDPAIPIQFVEVNGLRTRYIKTGTGPTLVLLHTLRTQLDIFQKVIPGLAREFTVYAMDYPGHGWSDIPKVDYTPDYFTRFATGFLDALNLRDVLIAGVSIGATIPLLMAAERNPRIRAVVSVNPYDYGKRGADRANAVAKVLFTAAAFPVIGETVMRLRNRQVEGKVLEGGVTSASALPASFREEVFVVGERPGHYQAFLNLIRNMPLWRRAHEVYGRIQVPVLLIYGDHDWSRAAERETTLREIPGARLVMVENGGHFLVLDQPESVLAHLRGFAAERRRLPPRAPTSTLAT